MSARFPGARALGPADVGLRVVVRRRLPSGVATDTLGVLSAWDHRRVVISRPDGAEVWIDADSILAAKRVPPAPVRIRPAGVADAEDMETLRARCWQAAYRGMIPGSFLDAMPDRIAGGAARRAARMTEQAADLHHLVAESAPTPSLVGWVAGGPSRDADRPGATAGEVYACYVAPEWSGVGIGGRLIRRLLGRLGADGRPDLSLWVLAGNDPARRFAASLGFTPDGRQRTLDLGGPVVEIRAIR